MGYSFSSRYLHAGGVPRIKPKRAKQNDRVINGKTLLERLEASPRRHVVAQAQPRDDAQDGSPEIQRRRSEEFVSGESISGRGTLGPFTVDH